MTSAKVVAVNLEPVVDEFIDDSTVIFETECFKERGGEKVPQEVLVRHHRVRNEVRVVDHCN